MKHVLVIISLVLAMCTAFAQSNSAKQTAAESAKQKAQLAASEKVYKAAKAAYQAKPSPKTKKAYVDATVAFGTKTMMAPVLAPRQKYRGALALYREALKLDPKNKEALNNKKLIEDIYTQMGMPIPK